MNCRGATLIDVLASIAIGAPIIVSLIAMVSSSVKLISVAEEQHRRVLVTRRIESISAILSNDINRHRLPVIPRIHEKGKIGYYDGTPLPISPQIPANRPESNSTAITYLRLSMGQARWITQHEEGGESEACRPSVQTLPPETVRGVLAISAEGIENMASSITQGSELTEKCVRVKLSALPRSMMTPTGIISPASVNIIIPIESMYTYFVSEGGELRLLSHDGQRTIEHQPVHVGITTLSCARTAESSLGLRTYSLRLSLPPSTTIETHLTPKLSRMSVDEILVAFSHLQ